MTHQIDVLSAQKCSCFSRCVRARIVVVKSDPSSAVGFPYFLKNNCKQMIVYYSEFTVLRCSNGMGATCPVFPKKQATICLDILEHSYSRLLFTFGLVSENTRLVTCNDVKDVFHRDRMFLTFLSI